MASTSAESAVPVESVPVEGNLKLRSLDDKEFLFPLKDVKKAAMLQTMIADLGLDSEEAMESQPVPLPSVGGDALQCIVEWCRLHADEAPRSDEDRGRRALRPAESAQEAGRCHQRRLLP
ncbi:hypothetical protein QR680_007534 [Steinernema hermaphroditum]|uniref:SKP1 component POZ domain-containing protein n=1 Tax=Steinernema hermaphroditum TaxID=289476 RepID=A0AA39IDH2_9BILA|nr:hypothetical protein QR680_007534 [Steinernema hermaphroditum]